MRRNTGFYSVILTSIVCMLGGSAFGAVSAVRVLGAASNTIVGGSSDKATAGGTSSVGAPQTSRASSIRFGSNAASATAGQSYSGLVSSTAGTASSVSPTTGRLSVGKYLNLSHSTKNTGTSSSGSGSSSGGTNTSSSDIDALRSEVDQLQTQLESLNSSKQNALVVGNGEYIDISGPGNNVISIDVEALKGDLQTALGTERELLTEIDEDYKLWWCYANDDKTSCSGEKQEIVDLGKVLDEYDVVNENVSLKEALAGKQGKLTETANGFIAIDQDAGTIDVKFNELKDALGMSQNKTSEIRYTEDGKLQWRYMDDFESDGTTPKWNTADVAELMRESLDDYVQTQTLADYVQRSELAGLQGALTADANGYLKIENNQIGVKFDELKSALDIPAERDIEMEITSGGALRWRHSNDFEADGETKKWTVVSENINDLIDGKLVGYVKEEDLQDLQGRMTTDANGYLVIDGNSINVKFDELRSALNIPAEQSKIEMEITSGGALRWRYLNDFESDGETKKWTVVSANINDLIDGKLTDYVQRSELAGLQGALTADANGYLKIEDNQIGVKLDDLRSALNIPAAQSKIEMEITSGGALRWRYLNDFEADGETKKWTIVSENINDLIDAKLAGYQATLTTDANGYLTVDGNSINVKFEELRNALNIPEVQSKIEMEITSDGALRWRYLDEFEADGETKKWTTVSVNIGDLIDGKLAAYVSNESLTTTLNNYVTSGALTTELQNYATTTYLDTELAKKQVKLTEAENGFIAITPTDGSDTIGIKFNELKSALGIDSLRTSEIRVDNGVLQWRYMNEFEEDPTTGEQVKKWTNVYDLKDLLNGYVKESDFNTVITRIDSELAGKQIKLTPAENGYIILNEQTGEIAVDMASLRNQLSIDASGARTSEIRVYDGELQWRYLDEFVTDENNNQDEVWHTLDLDQVNMTTYVKKNYLANNYYNKIYIDSLAQTIENNINTTLERLALPDDGPSDNGLYLLSIADGDGNDKNRTWRAVQIVDGDGVIH